MRVSFNPRKSNRNFINHKNQLTCSATLALKTLCSGNTEPFQKTAVQRLAELRARIVQRASSPHGANSMKCDEIS